MSNYHQLKIDKYPHNSPFKLAEESLEFIDAISSNNKIMAIQELSDLYSVIRENAKSLGFSMKDLEIMADTTESVFKSGGRSDVFATAESFYEYLKQGKAEYFGLGFISVRMSDQLFYNFYDNSLIKTSDWDKPRNHSRDFVSEILCGELTNIEYELGCLKEMIVLENKDISCTCKPITNVSYKEISRVTYNAGEMYQLSKNTFHSVESSPIAITRMTKLGDKSNTSYFVTDEHASNKITIANKWEIVRNCVEYMYESNN
jgi:predicted house-cleaning noncanonical NTP pyrophosphatase (MazG superfamily)